MSAPVDPRVEELARQKVAEDEARITGTAGRGQRRTSQTLGEVFRAFWHHPSPYILTTCLVAAGTARVLVGGGSWWELAVPAGLLAVMPVVEWLIHVCILHWRPRKVAGVTVDPLLSRKHRQHHASPREIPLVFVPWQVELYLPLIILGVAWLVMPGWPATLTMVSVVYLLLSGYEWTHYLLHSDYRPRSRWYRAVWRNHRLHHYKSEHYWFTVTTAGTADRLFGTNPDPSTVPTSPTVQRLHALDL